MIMILHASLQKKLVINQSNAEAEWCSIFFFLIKNPDRLIFKRKKLDKKDLVINNLSFLVYINF